MSEWMNSSPKVGYYQENNFSLKNTFVYVGMKEETIEACKVLTVTCPHVLQICFYSRFWCLSGEINYLVYLPILIVCQCNLWNPSTKLQESEVMYCKLSDIAKWYKQWYPCFSFSPRSLLKHEYSWESPASSVTCF